MIKNGAAEARKSYEWNGKKKEDNEENSEENCEFAYAEQINCWKGVGGAGGLLKIRGMGEETALLSVSYVPLVL